MTLDAKCFSMAAAIVSAFLWLVCSATVSIAPGPAMTIALQMMHAQRSEFTWHLSWGGVLIGLVAWTMSAAVAAWLLAWTYNRLARTASP